MAVSQDGVSDPTYADTLPIESIRFIPCIQQGCHTRLADADQSKRILAYLQGISDHANVGEDGSITYSEENRNTQGGVNTSPSRSKEPAAAPEGTELPAEIPQVVENPENPEAPSDETAPQE